MHIKTLRFLNTTVVNLNRCAYDSLNQTAVNEKAPIFIYNYLYGKNNRSDEMRLLKISLRYTGVIKSVAHDDATFPYIYDGDLS